jgi:hypothetical protein
MNEDKWGKQHVRIEIMQGGGDQQPGNKNWMLLGKKSKRTKISFQRMALETRK